MRRKALLILLGAEAALCLILYGARAASAAWITTILAFPFEQAGLLLRRLSLSGAAGNAGAILLYLLFSLLPVLALLPVLRRRKPLPEDGALGILSLLLFGVLYLMVNPGLMEQWLGGAGMRMGKALLGGTVYALLCAYLVFRLLRLLFSADMPRLTRYGSALLWVLAMIWVYAAFGACFGGFLDSVQEIRESNTGGGLGLTYGFLALRLLVDALPYLLDVWALLAAQELLAAEAYSEARTAAADRLARRCALSLAVTVGSNGLLNLMQLLFARSLRTVSSLVMLPVQSMVLVLAALLLARLLRENKRLKDDNDLFV